MNDFALLRRNLFRMQVYHLFGWFWLMNFIVAFGECVLAGAFASWYWAWDKKTVNLVTFISPSAFDPPHLGSKIVLQPSYQPFEIEPVPCLDLLTRFNILNFSSTTFRQFIYEKVNQNHQTIWIFPFS